MNLYFARSIIYITVNNKIIWCCLIVQLPNHYSKSLQTVTLGQLFHWVRSVIIIQWWQLLSRDQQVFVTPPPPTLHSFQCALCRDLLRIMHCTVDYFTLKSILDFSVIKNHVSYFVTSLPLFLHQEIEIYMK